VQTRRKWKRPPTRLLLTHLPLLQLPSPPALLLIVLPRALSAATEAQACCEANRESMERMFQKSMSK
jgi:hypothetical protein